MKSIGLIIIFLIILSGCEKQDVIEQKKVRPVVKSKEERLLEKQQRDKLFNQMIAERKEKYKDMLSINRESGDIRGIWYMKGTDIKNMKGFLNSDIKHSSGYCIEVLNDQKNAKIYFAVINKVFNVQIEKLSETKYAMIYGDKKRLFEVLNLSHALYKNSKDMVWFFEDSHKYNPKKGSEQYKDGTNFFDYCTSGINEYDCTVEGCLKDIKERDGFSAGGAEGPLGNK